MLDQADYDHYRINHPQTTYRWIITVTIVGVLCGLSFSAGKYIGRTNAKFICPIATRLA